MLYIYDIIYTFFTWILNHHLFPSSGCSTLLIQLGSTSHKWKICGNFGIDWSHASAEMILMDNESETLNEQYWWCCGGHDSSEIPQGIIFFQWIPERTMGTLSFCPGPCWFFRMQVEVNEFALDFLALAEWPYSYVTCHYPGGFIGVLKTVLL